jgi:hypothetical protein
MAKRKASKNRRTGKTPEANRNVPPAERELVVLMEPVSGLRASDTGLAAPSAESVQDVNAVLASYGATIRPLFGSDEPRLARDVAGAPEAAAQGSEITQYYRVEAADENLEEIAEALREQPSVKAAYVKPPAEPPRRLNDMLPAALEAPAITPDFTSRQGYLLAAPGGVDANFAWTVSGGRGDGIRVIDIEGAWLFSHEDLLGIREELSEEHRPAISAGETTARPSSAKSAATPTHLESPALRQTLINGPSPSSAAWARLRPSRRRQTCWDLEM